jgi:riboflavin kinase / FMN adenylyltransferase
VLLLHGIDGLIHAPAGAAMTIGNFDGLHLGHRAAIDACRRHRDENGSPVVVVTFEPHPLTVLRPSAVPPRLTPASLKEELIESLGVDAYVVLAPEPGVLNLTAEDFWKILRDQTRPRILVEGMNFNFGKGRGGNVRNLAEWCAGSEVRFQLIEPISVAMLDLKLAPVSSSLVRWLLSNGRVRDAAICLGRPYRLRGPVVSGFQRGRKLGTPTANLQCNDQLIPADGIYAGRCIVDSRSYPAAVSIGDMPTFGGNVRQIEAHLLDFEGDLYGQSLDLDLIDWLREQTKFSSADALKAQIEQDIIETRRRIDLDPAQPIVAV